MVDDWCPRKGRVTPRGSNPCRQRFMNASTATPMAAATRMSSASSSTLIS
jgi:hypothetical protein